MVLASDASDSLLVKHPRFQELHANLLAPQHVDESLSSKALLLSLSLCKLFSPHALQLKPFPLQLRLSFALMSIFDSSLSGAFFRLGLPPSLLLLTFDQPPSFKLLFLSLPLNLGKSSLLFFLEPDRFKTLDFGVDFNSAPQPRAQVSITHSLSDAHAHSSEFQKQEPAFEVLRVQWGRKPEPPFVHELGHALEQARINDGPVHLQTLRVAHMRGPVLQHIRRFVVDSSWQGLTR